MDAKNLVGTTLDTRYDIKRVIGAGGMGAVYEAQHVGTGRRVAIKVISTGDYAKDAQLVGRFQREAKAAGAIDTQHICQVLDTGTDPESGLPYMVMEFMSGEDLQQLLRRAGPLAVEVSLRIAAQTCLGLQKAHDTGVVHRDIKPANLFLAQGDGGHVTLKVLDFGIAKVKMEHATDMGDAGLTRTGTMLGSPLYMSPEQARGVKHIDHRADIWSLGVVLYESLCGRTPFHHIEALGELIIAICSEPPRPLQDHAPWVSPEVAAIVHKALKAAPADRFQTAQEMFDALKEHLPNGFTLEESILISLSETQRREVAKRLSMPPPGVPIKITVPPPAMDSMPPPAPAQEAVGTTGGVAAPTMRHPPVQKSSVPLIIAGAAIGIAVAGFVAYRVTSETATAEQVEPPKSTPATLAPTATAAAATATNSGSPTVSPAPQTRTVKVVVMPDDAKVTVDGEPVKVKNGWVEIVGAQGTVHKVKLTSGKFEIEEDVVVTDSGALPPKVELDVKTGVSVKAPSGSSTGTPSVVVKKPPGIEEKFE